MGSPRKEDRNEPGPSTADRGINHPESAAAVESEQVLGGEGGPAGNAAVQPAAVAAAGAENLQEPVPMAVQAAPHKGDAAAAEPVPANGAGVAEPVQVPAAGDEPKQENVGLGPAPVAGQRRRVPVGLMRREDWQMPERIYNHTCPVQVRLQMREDVWWQDGLSMRDYLSHSSSYL